MANHNSFAFNCTNSTQKQKNVEKYLEMAMLHSFHYLGTTQIIVLREIPGRERRMRWIAASRIDRDLSFIRPTGICSVYFEEGPGLTKLNPVSSIFAIAQRLKRKPSKRRCAKAAKGNTTDVEEQGVYLQKQKETLNRN